METESSPGTELLPLNTIRVETALSRYPVHRLARKGSIKIEVSEQNGLRARPRSNGRSATTATTASPGPLAYKIDTLIINRRIEEAPRPIPRIIKLGSLNDICRELGISQGKNIVTIKNALHQNASAYITAKIRIPADRRHRADAGSRLHPLQRGLHRRKAARRPQGRWRLHHPQRCLHPGHQRGDHAAARLRLPQEPAPCPAAVLRAAQLPDVRRA